MTHPNSHGRRHRGKGHEDAPDSRADAHSEAQSAHAGLREPHQRNTSGDAHGHRDRASSQSRADMAQKSEKHEDVEDPMESPETDSPRDGASREGHDGQRRFTVEDFQDLAKLGSGILKRTVSSGIEVIKEVKKDLPKEASQLISKGKEEVLKGISKEVMQNVLTATVDRFFAVVREHKLDITVSVRLKKADESRDGRETREGRENRENRDKRERR